MIAISASDLRAWGACEVQVLLFERIFGDFAEVSTANLSRASNAGLDIAWLAGNPSTPVESLRGLASDASERVRANVAGNPSTPVESLRGLASEDSEGVRERVAGNPSAKSE